MSSLCCSRFFPLGGSGANRRRTGALDRSDAGSNPKHQIIEQFDTADWTMNFYDANQKLVGRHLPTVLLVTNQYYSTGASKGLLEFTKEYRIGAGNVIEWLGTNTFTYENMLPKMHEDERGLIVTNSWDPLRRLTGNGFSGWAHHKHLFHGDRYGSPAPPPEDKEQGGQLGRV